ncbi:MAG: MMPL family transporter [Crocinitomicaceae bacterium]|nr:MMPL family transporter [Crocinitomicaceae bacterium]MDG1735125.1 MMPL family transporter [Crocinitomicaceae bacterium]
MWQGIANFILRNRFLLIGAITLITVFFGYSALTNLKLDNKYGIVLPKDSPTTTNYDKFKELFGEDGNVLVVAIKTDSLYTESRFKKWKQLGDSILKFEGVESVTSEATLITLKNDKEKKEFVFERVFEEDDTLFKKKSIHVIKDEVRNNPFYKGLLYSDSGNVSIMMIGISESTLADQKKSKIVLQIEDLARGYESAFGKIHFAGLPHLRVVIATRIQNEMFLFIVASMLVTGILLYLFFRSFRVVGICLTVVAIAVVWALGSIGVMGFDLTILMALIPPLMIVIGIPNCVFLMTKFHQEVKEHGNKVKALSRVIQKIGTATLLTNFTTAIGFMTFAFTNSIKLMEFGIAASINIMLVFIISICVLPIFASFSKRPKSRHLKHLDRKVATGLLDFIVYNTANRRPLIYISTIVLIVVSFIGLYKMEATGNLTGDLPKDDPISQDVRFLEKHFGGSIPFEMMIHYNDKDLFNFKDMNTRKVNNTLEKLARIDAIQDTLRTDSLFSKSISIVDFIKALNMAYYSNDTSKYKLRIKQVGMAKTGARRQKEYFKKLFQGDIYNGGFSIKEVLDTNSQHIRIRCQMKDLGSYEVSQKVESLRNMVNRTLNPNKAALEKYYANISRPKDEMDSSGIDYADSIFILEPGIKRNLIEGLAKKDIALRNKFYENKENLYNHMDSVGFHQVLYNSIQNEYFDVTFTGTSVVASEGTKYLVKNLITSLIFAIICIGILMAILFRSWRMVVISMVPNIIPLLFTGGIMGWFGIPLKPSTLLVFSIAFGISVDDTIHYLAKYRQELKNNEWDLKTCVNNATREAGLGMFYTSIVLFSGFSVFMFSQFGGTQALGMLVSITLLVAMLTNLMVLPSLLLSLDRLITTKSFKEPYFEAYDEEDEVEWNALAVENEIDDENKLSDKPRKE